MPITKYRLQTTSFKIADKQQFQQQLLQHFSDIKNLIFINKNNSETNLIAVAKTDNLVNDNWQFGFISYDYKNSIEQLISNNIDGVHFVENHFFSPELLFEINETEVVIHFEKSIYNQQQVVQIFEETNEFSLSNTTNQTIKITPRLSKQEYLEKVKRLQQHIQLGDIYEVNFCQEFYADQVEINPLALYLKLNKKSPTPFSCFVKHNDTYLLCASPERFIKKTGDKIISQPIKGTARRGSSEAEDEVLKEQLKNDPKERSENVMIVDLVRNDLSKIAQKGSVNVDELCGVYTFPQVHQLISTVSAIIEKGVEFQDIIQATFPMGSMTGPRILLN